MELALPLIQRLGGWFTVTVAYTPLSATGSNAVSGTRPVSVTMQIAQR